MRTETDVTVPANGPREYGAEPPYGPDRVWPELQDRLPVGRLSNGPVYGAVRQLLLLAGLDSEHRETAAKLLRGLLATGDPSQLVKQLVLQL